MNEFTFHYKTYIKHKIVYIGQEKQLLLFENKSCFYTRYFLFSSSLSHLSFNI